MSDLEVSTGTSNSNARVDKTNGRKRERGGDDARRPTKRLKSLTQEESQRMSIQEYTEQLRVALANLKSLPETNDIVDDDIKDSINNLLPRVCDKILEDPPHATTLAILQDPIPTFKDNTNFQRLNSMQQAHFRFFVQDVSNQLTKIAKVYKELLEDEKYAPSATQYADPTVWPKWQGKEAGILNLRPSTNQGLPLSTLHSIFARFRATLHQQLSGVAAMQAAHNLCVKMPDAFETEKRRREVFMDCLYPLFNGYRLRCNSLVDSDLERHPSTADLVLSYRTSDVLVGVCDLECGTGDAYMRISRVYKAWVNRLKHHKSSELAHGVPLILICVMGPVFIVSGGFFDGDSVLVEPLAQPCLMLPDYHHQRQSQLASVLHATKEAVEGLLQIDYSVRVAFEPALPRVYPSFTSFEDAVVGLEFESRLILTRDPNRDLLFLAIRADSLQQVLVKLVAGDQYGVGAHRKLGDAGYAPILFGMAKVEGAPTAYVMEYLALENGWTTLGEYIKRQSQGISSRIKGPIDRILETMEGNDIVHGDLRPNNIMVRKVEGELEMKLVDFDWAGESGKVRYPFRRNESIFWPAGAGEPIVTGHDRLMVTTCLDEQFK